MIITSRKQKLLLFMFEKNMTQRQVAQELGVTYEHLCRVLAGKHPISAKLHQEIENLFKRYEFQKALDEKGRL